jgi:hypothetical protein
MLVEMISGAVCFDIHHHKKKKNKAWKGVVTGNSGSKAMICIGNSESNPERAPGR